MMKWIILIFVLVSQVFAADFYYAGTAQGSNNGTSCANAYAYNDGTNGISTAGKWVANNILHVCGTWSGGTNQSPFITAAGSGSNGSPITIFFETGAILQASYFQQAAGGSAGGAITLNGKSWIVVDGNNLQGTIQNTLNGVSGATCVGGACSSSAGSSYIAMFNCTNCTVKNLNFPNAYIAQQNNVNNINSTNVTPIMISGSNNVVSGSTFSNCGWCVNFNFNNNDSNFQGYNNTFSNNYGHAFAAYGTSAACLNPCTVIHDNQFGAAGLAWDAAGCPNHKDGVHYYGASGTTQDGDLLYNNYFFGDWGLCPTGFVYADNAASDPGIKNWSIWNNHFVVVNTSFINTNAWIEMSARTAGGTQFFGYNTFQGNGNNDNTLAIQLSSDTSLTFVGNFINAVGNPIRMDSTTITQTDYNVYGSNVCQNGGNCFTWNGAFLGKFTATRYAISSISESGTTVTAILSSAPNFGTGAAVSITGVPINGYNTSNVTIACSAPCTTFTYTAGSSGLASSSGGNAAQINWQDATTASVGSSQESHSISNLIPNVNSDGTPKSNYVGVQWGINEGSIATGNLATLQNDTTNGGTRTSFARPATAACTQGTATCWDIGAYQFNGSIGGPSTFSGGWSNTGGMTTK